MSRVVPPCDLVDDGFVDVGAEMAQLAPEILPCKTPSAKPTLELTMPDNHATRAPEAANVTAMPVQQSHALMPAVTLPLKMGTELNYCHRPLMRARLEREAALLQHSTGLRPSVPVNPMPPAEDRLRNLRQTMVMNSVRQHRRGQKKL